MVNTNSTCSVTNSSNPPQVDRPQLAVQAEGEAAPGPSPPIEAAEAEAEPGPSPTIGAGNPESRRPVPAMSFQQSPRAWRSGGSCYPLTTNHDGDSWGELYKTADQFDKEFYEGWISEIDSIPTFAGLLAAVVTAFAIESYKLLQPNLQQMTNQTLLNISAQLAGRSTTEPPPFTLSSYSLRINTFWFLSLTCSLMAGLVAILCKQWLRQYRRQGLSLPYKEALAFRQLRYEGMSQWKVTKILSALPLLLTLGLVLFFIGLIDFLHHLDAKLISIPVTVFIGTGFVFLLVTTAGPALQYIIVQHQHSRRHSWDALRPALFAFKSPQSLAILHLATWLFPPPANLKLPDWTSWELAFFSNSFTLHTYTGRALTWLDETYSHSLDMVRQICLCLQDIEDDLGVEDMDEHSFWDFTKEDSSTAVIQSLFDTSHPQVNPAVGHVRRDIIAMRYLYQSRSFYQYDFAFLEHLIRVLNSSHHQIHALEPFRWMFSELSFRARDHPAEQLQELILQRAILFQNLLLEGRLMDSTDIPWEVQNVSENLKLFANEDLDSIFDVVRAWMDRHPHGADLPSHCCVAMTAHLERNELDGALRCRPPIRDFMAFLHSRFQMSDGVKYLCSWYYDKEKTCDSFFAALYAWIDRNPQDIQSFAHSRWTLVTTVDSYCLERMRGYQSFRDFEAFLEEQIARNGDIVVRGPIHDP